MRSRVAKHDAKKDRVREGCDFLKMQLANMREQIKEHGVQRPIHVWRKGKQRIIVDGIKTYQIAKDLGKPFEVEELKFADEQVAKLWRFNVNVSTNRNLAEDVRVWNFLDQFNWLIAEWQRQGRKNQAKRQLSKNDAAINWRIKAAQACQTSRSRIDVVWALRREDQWAAEFDRAKLDKMSEKQRAIIDGRIKQVEDGVNAVLSGSRTASSVISDIKGGAARSAKSGKEGDKGRGNRSNIELHDSFDGRRSNQLIVGNSFEILPTIGEGLIDHFIFSPPYFKADVSYGVEAPWLKTWNAYCQAMREILTEIHRILPKGGTIIANIDDTSDKKTGRWYKHTRLIEDICLDLGMIDLGTVIWHKQNVSGKKHAKGSNRKQVIRPNHEYVVAFAKGQPHIDIPSHVYGEANHLTLSTWLEDSDVEELNEEHWEAFTNFWTISPSFSPNHPCVFPPKLAYRCLTRYTGLGDVVCDPFSGIGTTATQCVMTGRRYVGIEYGRGYAENAAQNVSKAQKATDDLTLERVQRCESYLKGKFLERDSNAKLAG